jgi:hypothetical protein
MINIKTQTKRSTNFREGIINLNLFCGDFEFGIVTSKYWGNFEERKIPLIEMEIDGKNYQIPLNEFKKIIIEMALKRHKK